RRPSGSAPNLKVGYVFVGIGIPWAAGLIQPFDLLGGQGPAGSDEIGFELLHGPHPDDRGGDERALKQPVDRDLRRGPARVLGYREEGIQQGPGALGVVPAPGLAPAILVGDRDPAISGRPLHAAAELAAEPAA